MTLEEMVDVIKRRPDFDKVGMIVCHNGVVRATSRHGHRVKGLKIVADHVAVETVVQEMRERKGIVEVAVHLYEGYREVGEDVMLVAIAGDIRENVLPVFQETIERLKKEAAQKEEFLID
jgi:molybdopterin synthase catalytic subunit